MDRGKKSWRFAYSSDSRFGVMESSKSLNCKPTSEHHQREIDSVRTTVFQFPRPVVVCQQEIVSSKGQTYIFTKSDRKKRCIWFWSCLTGTSNWKKSNRTQVGEEKDIVYWDSTHLGSRDDIIEVLDKRISGTAMDDMVKVLRIATVYTTKLPSLRPNMQDVVKMLADADPYIIITAEKNPDSD
ncbi:hypothetical protein IFM89_021096 [Coptis chinensis]|uniref:Uncharacterized protein n=1 Tax=Coptis chinensis TaxID=261450 RepID=A0A835LNK9_9MAGN|nr:hypothetical protein IFM89_021096 [Coptis chinensis]